ncbi:hypermethylated in cancer 2 protein-like [Scleropages formosus]|uniref:Hypermethylated in cancer 2 protein n=1 Tax=Scleropages formosus TaxID=113540 RepID=A0A8C9RZ27_SCLFO|nr:hypermethylated in cancer 2 protein-like [Scleropages formosus]
MEFPNHARQLLLQLNQQRAKGFLCDVIIVVENALFRAHKNILAASSMYFKSLMLHDNLVNLDTDMVNPSVFRQVLDFIYTGRLPSVDQPSDKNFNALLTAASYLQLHDLAALCRKRLKGSENALPGKSAVSNGAWELHKKELSTAVTQGHVSSSEDCDDAHRQGEQLNDKLSDDEPFASSSPCVLSAGQSGSSNVGNVGRGEEEDEDDEDDQELGLDLSKKSPSESSVTEEISPQSLREESPQSDCISGANSASSEDCSTQHQDLEGVEAMDLGEQAREQSQVLPHADPPRQRARQANRKKNWPRKGRGKMDAVEQTTQTGGSEESKVGAEQPSSRGSLSSDRSFHCGEDGENEKEHSEESGQSEGESLGANYVYRQEGFEAVVGDNLYVCIPCGKGFPSSERLNAHVETHTEEELCIKEEAEDLSARAAPAAGAELQPFECSVCSKSYKDPVALRQHEKGHWLSRPFPCHICGKMFTQRGTMTRHMRSHLGLKPFACEECGMRFTRQYRLTEHMRVHSGEKPYECQLCGGKFTQQRNLVSHLRMHTSPA